MVRFGWLVAALLVPTLCSAQGGTYQLEEATRPFSSGDVVVRADGGVVRFDLRVEGGGRALVAAGPATGAGPWELREGGSGGEAGALAGESGQAVTVHRFRLNGRYLVWIWEGAGGKGCGVFRSEDAPAAAEAIALTPPGEGWREHRFEPYVGRDGTVRGQATFTNDQGVEVRVFRHEGAVEQVIFTRGDRQYALLPGGELAVVDFVFDRISRNHCKIYGFPGDAPTQVAFSDGGGLSLTFANGDQMTREPRTLALVPASSDFAEKYGHTTYREGTRSLPQIRHTGSRPATLSVWYEYPPWGGTMSLVLGSERVATLPVTSLYRKVQRGGGDYDVERRFGNLETALRRLLAGRSDPGSRRYLAALDP